MKDAPWQQTYKQPHRYLMKQTRLLLVISCCMLPLTLSRDQTWNPQMHVHFYPCIEWVYPESKDFQLEFMLSVIIRNITEISQRQQMGRRKPPSSPDAIEPRPVKCYLKLPALGFLQQLMKSLHGAYIPGIMNSFWLMLLTKVYSCIQNISISSVGLGTDSKPGAPAGRYGQESI